ncbi:MAG: nucleotidyl transferase AbiEii/AbiGii toxin family protein [Candidatus Levybacteria bacterium]|nr:nucleotidyl transferase AbiEii/AbiGii toxin family protein [Candidatus Levybacteria bacterium]
MFTKALLPDTVRAIQLVSHIPTIHRAYLAGGTALALQIGHRISVDLDFFTQEKFDENLVATELSHLSQFKEQSRSWATVLGWVGETKFSIFFYKPRLIEETIPFEGIQLAAKKDIVAMKLLAVSDRGLKRDFIDIFMLSKEFSLDEMLSFYDKKFGSVQDKLYAIIKGLSYFADATDDTPKMLIPVNWEEVKAFFRKEAKRLAKEKLGI